VEIELRHFREDDAEALNRAIAESLDHLRPWMAWASEPSLGTAARQAWIRERNREADGGGDESYGIWLADRIGGTIGLHDRIGPGAREIGYWVHAKLIGRGIATAAVLALVEKALARPSLRRLEIRHDAANEPSGRVAAAAGFTLVGEHRRAPRAPAETGVERVWRRLR
jgi:RimJ/RimL family protein N-acetyltransferase